MRKLDSFLLRCDSENIMLVGFSIHYGKDMNIVFRTCLEAMQRTNLHIASKRDNLEDAAALCFVSEHPRNVVENTLQ